MLEGQRRRIWIRWFLLKLLTILKFLLKKGFISNVDIKKSIHSLNQILDTRVSNDTMVQVNPNTSTTASRIRDLKKNNPLTFFGSKGEEDPPGYIGDVFKVLDAMGVSFKKSWNYPPTNCKMWIKISMSNGRMRGRLEKVRLLMELSIQLFLIGSFP